MSLSGTRPWVLAGVIGALVVVALAWLAVIGPTRSETTSLRADTATVQQQNQVLSARIDQLRNRNEDRDQIQAKVRGLLETLPGDPHLPELNQQLVQHAAARGVVLTSISVAAATAPGVAEGASPTGVVSVPVTIQSRGLLRDQLAFLQDLQKTGPRAALVTSTSIGASDGGPADSVILTTQFTVFAAALSAADLSVLPQ